MLFRETIQTIIIIARIKSFKHDNLLNVGYHFNGCDCSLNNLVWIPLNKVSDDLEAESHVG